MAVEIKVPALGESVTEATVAKWLVKAGDAVTIDQPLCELETDKVTVEVNATVAGTIVDLAVAEGATVQVGGVLCHIEAGAAGAAAAKPAAAPAAAAPKPAPAPAPSPAPRCRRSARCPRRRSRRGQRQYRRLRSGHAQAGRGDRRGAVGDPADRQGRPRHQGRRDGGTLVDSGADCAAPPSRRCRPARARAPTARSACA